MVYYLRLGMWMITLSKRVESTMASRVAAWHGAMGLKELALLLVFFCCLVLVHGAANERQTMEDGLRMDAYLHSPPHKYTVKTIKSSIGDTFDCVDINKQPAFDHPLLKNHTIQMNPTSLPSGMSNNFTSNIASSDIEFMTEKCPVGTIPIMRTRKNNFTTTNHLSYFKAGHTMNAHSLNSTVDGLDVNNMKFAQIRMKRGEYYGATAEINVYGLPRVSPNQFSCSAIWLINDGDGLEPLEQTNSIIAGWMVNPHLFGDTRTRLFVYWTADGYQRKGCYNLLCQGFIQVNHEIALGVALHPLSVYKGPQFIIAILVYKDSNTDNWWMLWGRDMKPIGYWPKSLFSTLVGHANLVNWGGAVYTPPNEKSPPMGNGHYPYDGYKDACHFKKVKLVDKLKQYIDVNIKNTTDYQDRCYEVGYFDKKQGEREFPFGGPGGC